MTTALLEELRALFAATPTPNTVEVALRYIVEHCADLQICPVCRNTGLVMRFRGGDPGRVWATYCVCTGKSGCPLCAGEHSIPVGGHRTACPNCIAGWTTPSPLIVVDAPSTRPADFTIYEIGPLPAERVRIPVKTP